MSFERRLLAGALGAWLVVSLLCLVFGPSLGHDEAAFAVAARDGGSIWLYRSSGAIELARGALSLGGAEWALRVPNVLAGATVVVATWAVARAAAGERVAAWSAAVIAGCQAMTLHSAELMGDLPSCACVLAGIAVIIGELRRDDGPRWRFVLVAPAFAAAFYLRYGNSPAIALAGVLGVAFWGRSIAKRPLPVVATVALFAALLAPHVLASLDETGSVFGIVRASAAMPRRAYFAEGVVGYVGWVPLLWYGVLVTPLVVLGAVAPARHRAAVYLAAVGVGEVLALGVASHARARYIYVAIALLAIAGVERALRVIESRRRLALAIVGLSWLGPAVAAVPFEIHLARARVPVEAAAEAIRTDAHGAPCTVIAGAVTQLMWYTGCDGVLLRDPTVLPSLPLDRRAYVVSMPHQAVTIARVTAVVHASATSVTAGASETSVWLLHPLVGAR